MARRSSRHHAVRRRRSSTRPDWLPVPHSGGVPRRHRRGAVARSAWLPESPWPSASRWADGGELTSGCTGGWRINRKRIPIRFGQIAPSIVQLDGSPRTVDGVRGDGYADPVTGEVDALPGQRQPGLGQGPRPDLQAVLRGNRLEAEQATQHEEGRRGRPGLRLAGRGVGDWHVHVVAIEPAEQLRQAAVSRHRDVDEGLGDRAASSPEQAVTPRARRPVQGPMRAACGQARPRSGTTLGALEPSRAIGATACRGPAASSTDR